MKKIVAVIISIIITLTLFTSVPLVETTAYASDYASEMSNLSPVPDFDYEFLAPSGKWLNFVNNEKPATFSEDKIEYKLNKNVLVLKDQTVTNSIASAGQLIAKSPAQKLRPNSIVAEGGYVPIPVLDAAAAQQNRKIENNTVVVDETTGTAFKVVSPTIYKGEFEADKDLSDLVKPLENTYSIAKPELHEVIESFELQEDTIKLTRGNISGFAPNIEKNLVLPKQFINLAFNDSLKDFKYLSKDPLIKLQFTNEKLEGKLNDNSSINVRLSGGLGIDGIDLTGKYSGFGGYRIAMTLKQESYLVVELDAEVDGEVRVPILGIDVPFGIGRVSGGVFVIVGMDGTIRLEIEAREYTSTTVGVRGSTKFYVPTSFHPIFDNNLKTDGEVDLAGKINGYAKFGPMLDLEIFGFDLVGAGVFLGAGVNVEAAEGISLDVELYGIANIYINIVGKHFNLMNYRPTILRRTQADTGGYRIKIMEAFVNPGRVGGTIQMEDDPDIVKAEGYKPPEGCDYGYIRAPGIEYRILVMPASMELNPNDMNNAEIRKYPADGYAVTNEEGEFFQENDDMCINGDKVYLEFKDKKGKPYFSDPASPILPFDNIKITSADYFNDYATGQVMPKKVINWDAKPSDPPEAQYELAYYKNALIYVSPFQANIPGGQARTTTDEYGNFDTRNPLVLPPKTIKIFNMDIKVPWLVEKLPNNTNTIDIRPFVIEDFQYKYTSFDLTIDDHGATLTRRVYYNPTALLNMERVIDAVEGSYQRYNEGDKVIDRMVYDEYIWIQNPNGTRTVTEDEFDYAVWGFSTQDFSHRSDDISIENALAGLGAGENKWDTPPIVQPTGTKILTPVLDEDGKPTGTALFSQRVTVEWVWQPHPNPVKITSANHTQTTTKGGTFQVTASGFPPFAYSLIDAPSGVVVNKDTGLMTIPANLAEKDYTFTVQAAEKLDVLLQSPAALGLPDKKKGNDPSLPDKQIFTLTVIKETASAEEATEPPETVQPPAGATPPARTEPPEKSQPPARTEPPETSQPPETTEPPDTSQPPETPEPPVVVRPPETIRPPVMHTAPVIAEEAHGYEFNKLTGSGDLDIQIKARGSTPITYSLVVTNSRQSIPAEVSIDSGTGMLTVREGISTGQYFFTIKATNDVGSDTQDCRLDVTTLTPRKPPIIPKLPLSSGKASNLVLLSIAAESANKNQPSAKPKSVMDSIPLNSITIRCDHSKDVYSRNQLTTNGTTYIRWDSSAVITVEKAKTSYQIIDDSPVCDQYHYRDPVKIPADALDKIKKSFSEKLSDYQRSDSFLGERLGSMDLLKDFNNLRVNPLKDEMSYLEYGSLLDSLNQQKGGSFLVDLGGPSGTYVTGNYFVGLQDNKKAVLSFKQNGAEITFAGKDIKNASEFDLFNFAYVNQAPHEADILANVADGYENFTFGFAHHGELPGMADFNITTDIAPGTKVNVYKYDVDSKEFSQVAGNLIVGEKGVVTYQNNTMSEYLVTTQTFPTLKSERNYLWLFELGAVLIVIGTAGWFFQRKKKRQATY